MAKAQTKDEKEAADALEQELRQNVNDAYAFVEGQKSNQTFASLTFEDLMDQQIERLVGKDTDARPNVLHKVDRIEQKIVSAVAQIKKLPPEFFKVQTSNENANTPTEPEPDPEDGTANA